MAPTFLKKTDTPSYLHPHPHSTTRNNIPKCPQPVLSSPNPFPNLSPRSQSLSLITSPAESSVEGMSYPKSLPNVPQRIATLVQVPNVLLDIFQLLRIEALHISSTILVESRETVVEKTGRIQGFVHVESHCADAAGAAAFSCVDRTHSFWWRGKSEGRPMRMDPTGLPAVKTMICTKKRKDKKPQGQPPGSPNFYIEDLHIFYRFIAFVHTYGLNLMNDIHPSCCSTKYRMLVVQPWLFYETKGVSMTEPCT